MTSFGVLQITVFFLIILATAKPLGAYMARVFAGERTWLHPVIRPLERLIYRLCRIDEKAEQPWTGYSIALLIFSAGSVAWVYLLQRAQGWLPLNPQNLPAVPPHLAFNTAVSFTTNTNWQSYVPESTVSYLTQMLALTVQNFASAAAGIAIAIAVARGFARESARSIGNFWVDLVRATCYVLLPLSLAGALVLVSQGVIQNFDGYQKITTLEKSEQVIPQGPVASQEAIKMIGTNGGGFFNANSAHPYENPTPLSNFLETLFIFLIPGGLTYTFGRMVGDTRQGWALFAAMSFTAQTRMSGVDLNGRHIRKGAADSVIEFARLQGGTPPPELQETVERISRTGGTPLVVADGPRLLGVIHLKDVVKGGMRERFVQLRAMGIRTIMITGDNPLTAAAIAAEAGVDDFLAQATPKDKMDLIKREQAGGRLVAMTGDGTNDAPALAQADVGVAMNTGTMAAKEAGNMVDLDSNPTKLIEVVAIGKQLLITRGALTTFSIANDVAKYFAILPAMFAATYPPLQRLNIMGLHTPQSAVLASVIFNALIIIALIPLALRGTRYRPVSASALLRRNLLIYGFGGVVAPFPGIWLVDRLLGLLRLA